MNDHVRASLETCERVVRANARNFWWGLRACEARDRQLLFAIYAWMRLGDDIVDDTPDVADAKAKFAAFCASSCRAMAGDASVESASTCWPAFAWAVKQSAIPQEWLHEMLAGLAWDLEHQAFETAAQLDRYCYLVGGTVGLVCTHVWGVRSNVDRAIALQKADARGRSFQMINIARDIASDAKSMRPRAYVCNDVLAAAGVSRDAFLAWREPQACEKVVRSLCERADAYHASSRGLEAMIEPRGEPAMVAMTRVYQGVLDAIKARPSRAVLGPRASVPTLQKVAIGAQAAATQWWRGVQGSVPR